MREYFPTFFRLMGWGQSYRGRILLRFGTVIVLCLLLILRLNAVIASNRAENLLADLKKFRLNQTSTEEALRTLTTYGVRFETKRRIDDYYVLLEHSWAWNYSSRLLRVAPRFMDLVGEHPWRIYGGVDLQDGVVKGIAFGVTVRKGDSSYLQVGTATVENLDPEQDWAESLGEHPNYRVEKPNLNIEGGGESLRVTITSQADVAELSRALDFRLDCLSRYGGCRELKDLAPSAWRDLQARRAIYKQR